MTEVAVGSMLKAVPGGLVFLVGQSRTRWPASPHPKHFPDARYSVCSLSESLDVFCGLGLLPFDVTEPPQWLDLPFPDWNLSGGRGIDKCHWPSWEWDDPLVWNLLPTHPGVWWLEPKVTDLMDISACWDLAFVLPPLGPEEDAVGWDDCMERQSFPSTTFSDISIISAWETTSSQDETSGCRLSLHSPFWITEREPFQNLRTLSWSGIAPIMLNSSCSSWVYSATLFSFWWHGNKPESFSFAFNNQSESSS